MASAEPNIWPLESALSDIFAKASESCQITLADRYGLLALMLNGDLTEEERMAVDRLLRAVQKGRVCISSEISTIDSP